MNNGRSSTTTISAEGISKKYCTVLRRAMVYGASDIVKDVTGLPTHSDQLRKGEFWALKDLSFHVEAGQTLGIVGPNGSGKSTLLKLLNGIMRPDTGEIRTQGRVGALIEVGAGFHPMLTGRENVYVNGAILGMKKVEIDRRFDDIVQFAEIGEFLDVPVRFYSSGMFVRLGFAVAAHCDTDVLLIDEVLSVGDFKFQNRCAQWMRRFKAKGGTVVLVSHNMPVVASMANSVLLLHKGAVIRQGEPKDIVEQYMQLNSDAPSDQHEATSDTFPGETVAVRSVRLIDPDGVAITECAYGTPLRFEVDLHTAERLTNPRVIISVSRDGLLVFELNMLVDGQRAALGPGSTRVVCETDKVSLTPGTYQVNLSILDNVSGQMGRKWHVAPRRVAEFSVPPDEFQRLERVDKVFGTITRIPGMWVRHSWDVVPLDTVSLGSPRRSTVP